jgi:DNA-binding NarL/FixJ family response regulator
MIRVLLADDHPVVVDGLRRFLEDSGRVEVQGVASSLPEALERLEERPADVLVLDLNMSGHHGVETIRDLCRRVGFPAVVIFSMLAEDQFALSLIRAGAKAFLSKSRSPDELLEAIVRAAQGRPTITDRLAQKLLVAEGLPTDAPHEQLSERERQVFMLLVDGQTPKQIARQLSLAPSTVHTYTERVKQKLGVDSLNDVLRYAFRHQIVG